MKMARHLSMQEALYSLDILAESVRQETKLACITSFKSNLKDPISLCYLSQSRRASDLPVAIVSKWLGIISSTPYASLSKTSLIPFI